MWRKPTHGDLPSTASHLGELELYILGKGLQLCKQKLLRRTQLIIRSCVHPAVLMESKYIVRLIALALDTCQAL